MNEGGKSYFLINDSRFTDMILHGYIVTSYKTKQFVQIYSFSFFFSSNCLSCKFSFKQLKLVEFIGLKKIM